MHWSLLFCSSTMFFLEFKVCLKGMGSILWCKIFKNRLMSEQSPFNFWYIRRLFFSLSFIIFTTLLSEWNYGKGQVRYVYTKINEKLRLKHNAQKHLILFTLISWLILLGLCVSSSILSYQSSTKVWRSALIFLYKPILSWNREIIATSSSRILFWASVVSDPSYPIVCVHYFPQGLSVVTCKNFSKR